MAILGKLLSEGLQDAGEDIVEKGISKAVKKASKEGGESTLSKLGKKLFSNVDDVVGKKADDMVTLYRGLTQKYDPKFPVSRLDTSGYESFTDNLDLARQYGDNVVSINIPKRDIKTSYLDENPMSPTYGDRNPIYSIDKPAGLNGVSGKEYLLEVGSDYQKALRYNEVANDLDNASKFLQPKEPLTLYHGSPIKGIKDLDINMAGKNTMSGERAIYFTDDYPTAETFSYERNPSNSMFVDNMGKKGEVYARNVNTDNFLDLDNLTDDHIADLYNYIDPRSAGLMDRNKFIQTLNDARAAGNSQMIKAQLDLNKLANDYDGFMAKMYPGENDVREYGVFNPQNIITPDVEQYLPKKLAISGDDAAQDIPVYTKDDFITDPSIFDDPAFADIVKNNNIENVMKKGTKSDLELVKRAKAGEVLTKDEIRNSRFAKNLGIDAKKAQVKYGNKLNITKAMEEGTEKVPEELENRLRGMADQVLDRLHKDPNIKYDHKAVIFMGGPSSGKSSAGMKLYDAAKGGEYAVIDSDDIKPMFEEFGKGEGAGAVHLASAYTAKKMVLPDAAAEGMNLALPIVGKSDNALNYHLDLLKNAGYDVSVVDVSLPTDKAASRNFGRMMETNRNVEDTYVRDKVGQKPAEVYRKMVENVKAGRDKRVSGYAKISNDVKFGEPQILEEISPSDVLKRVQEKFGKNDDFGKSVVVDKKGKLLDLYHGTDASFDKFGDIKTEPGYWFTEDKNYAQSHGKNLMTVNLNMQNPIDMTTAEGEDLLYNLARERFGLKDFVPEDKIFSKEFREFLQSRGYDGLIWDKDGKNTYVAFRPDQIKMRNK